jgi:hypothetical protein
MSVVHDLVINTIRQLNVVSHDCVSMCTKKDYGLHCHLRGSHNIHKHLILCSSCSNPCPPEPSKNPPSPSAQSDRCRDIGALYRHYLLQRDPQECLHNLQPTTGSVLSMLPLLQANSFCRKFFWVKVLVIRSLY